MFVLEIVLIFFHQKIHQIPPDTIYRKLIQIVDMEVSGFMGMLDFRRIDFVQPSSF